MALGAVGAVGAQIVPNGGVGRDPSSADENGSSTLKGRWPGEVNHGTKTRPRTTNGIPNTFEHYIIFSRGLNIKVKTNTFQIQLCTKKLLKLTPETPPTH